MPDYGRIDETVEPELGMEPEPDVEVRELEEGDLQMMDAYELEDTSGVGVGEGGGGGGGDAEKDVNTDLDVEHSRPPRRTGWKHRN